MSIWDALVGQDEVVAQLERAVASAELLTRGGPGPAMTRAPALGPHWSALRVAAGSAGPAVTPHWAVILMLTLSDQTA